MLGREGGARDAGPSLPLGTVPSLSVRRPVMLRKVLLVCGILASLLYLTLRSG
jgi:hypothetical protein